MFIFMVALPVWDALTLVEDFNYVFFAGRNLQILLLTAVALTFLLFLFITEVLFSKVRQDDQTPQTLVMVLSLFITLLGFILILVQNPIAMRATEAHDQLVYHCSTGVHTMPLRNYYNTLLDVRKDPDCAKKYSIEECTGFTAQQPYARYLKLSEQHFRCSGFCVDGGSAALQVNASHALASHTTSSATAAKAHKAKTLLELLATAKYPPTLFSDANFKVSCDGAAARQLVSSSRDTAYQGWWVGVFFITLSIVMGLWEWTAITIK